MPTTIGLTGFLIYVLYTLCQTQLTESFLSLSPLLKVVPREKLHRLWFRSLTVGPPLRRCTIFRSSSSPIVPAQNTNVVMDSKVRHFLENEDFLEERFSAQLKDISLLTRSLVSPHKPKIYSKIAENMDKLSELGISRVFRSLCIFTDSSDEDGKAILYQLYDQFLRTPNKQLYWTINIISGIKQSNNLFLTVQDSRRQEFIQFFIETWNGMISNNTSSRPSEVRISQLLYTFSSLNVPWFLLPNETKNSIFEQISVVCQDKFTLNPTERFDLTDFADALSSLVFGLNKMGLNYKEIPSETFLLLFKRIEDRCFHFSVKNWNMLLQALYKLGVQWPALPLSLKTKLENYLFLKVRDFNQNNLDNFLSTAMDFRFPWENKDNLRHAVFQTISSIFSENKRNNMNSFENLMNLMDVFGRMSFPWKQFPAEVRSLFFNEIEMNARFFTIYDIRHLLLS
jgi:hypothetical protein